MIIIEFLNFQILVKILINKKKLKNTYANEVHYIYEEGIIFNFYKKIINILGFKCKKLNFKLINIREVSGELVSLKILREDFFEVENKIIDELSNLQSINEDINIYKKNYITKSILTETILIKKSYWRLIYLINVINKVSINKNKIMILQNRYFQNIITDYADKFSIKIIFTYFSFSILKEIILFIKNILRLNLISRLYVNKKGKEINNTHKKILCESFGQVNLINKNHKSDFFWLLNSSFPKENVFFDCKNKKDALHLNNNEIAYSYKYSFKNLTKSKKNNYFFKNKFYNKNYSREKKYVNNLLQSYNDTKLTLKNYYRKNNIMTIFNWYRYDQNHIVKHEAINEIGGISCLWQFAFEGQKYYDIKSFADINFSYSKFSSNIHKIIKSKFSKQIIVGLPTTELDSNIVNEAAQIKKNLFSAGAKKIICVLDENSSDDDRWHTGEIYQRETYKLIIEQILSNNDLGVIFKPKVSFTLRKRLKEVNLLLDEALKTKRCFIYSDKQKRATSTPPLVAALSADLVIHGHLSAGTAAIECAQKKIPTILIDREVALGSKLSELPKNKITFKNLESAIEAFNNHLFLNKPIEGFGDWSKFIGEFDPFNDNKGAYRIGSYLKDIIEGQNKSMKKDEILEKASKNYSDKWGKDKIIH